MKRASFDRCGPPEEVVELEEVKSPALPDGHVRLKVLASPINPADINFIEGRYGIKPDLPCTPGMEACGEVIESRSREFAPGAQVIFLGRADAWSEETIAAEDDLIALPTAIDPIQASMLKVNPLTAHCMLTLYKQLAPGDIVLQNAGNSNVGRCVIQLCKAWGITTISTVRRPELVQELKALGADHVLLETDDLRQKIPELGLAAPTLTLNCVGGDSALQQLKVLAEDGAQVTYGAMAKKPLTVPAGLMIFKTVNLHGYWLSAWMKKQSRQSLVAVYTDLARLIETGALTQAVDSSFPLTGIEAALLRAQESGRDGKVILLPSFDRISRSH